MLALVARDSITVASRHDLVRLYRLATMFLQEEEMAEFL
jgi:hypothetical protein